MTPTASHHAAMEQQIPLVVVMGATASGKTALAVDLALALDGEVVNADAMAVYADMQIGTARATLEEQRGVPHHVLGTVPPEDGCQLQQWLEAAEVAIQDIHQRGKRVIVAGGSPLYVKTLLEGISAGTPKDDGIRSQLEADYDKVGGEAMLERLNAVDPTYAADRHPNDKRRIVRALEVYEASGKPFSSFHVTDGIRRDCYRTLLIGLEWDKDTLHRRINARAKAMFQNGLRDEVIRLRPQLGSEAKQAVGYKEVIPWIDGEIDEERALYLVKRNTRLLAKHQMTWYRRFTDIHWIPGDAEDLSEQATSLSQEFLS